eukprot:5625032-Amphidinium_carterae.1
MRHCFLACHHVAQKASTHRQQRVPRPRVQFNLERSTIHEVPAYAEVYGRRSVVEILHCTS